MRDRVRLRASNLDSLVAGILLVSLVGGASGWGTGGSDLLLLRVLSSLMSSSCFLGEVGDLVEDGGEGCGVLLNGTGGREIAEADDASASERVELRLWVLLLSLSS